MKKKVEYGRPKVIGTYLDVKVRVRNQRLSSNNILWRKSGSKYKL